MEAPQCVLTGGGFPWEVAPVNRDAYVRRAVPEKEDPPVADAEFGDAVRVPDVQVALRKRPTGSSGVRGIREVLPGDDHGREAPVAPFHEAVHPPEARRDRDERGLEAQSGA